MLIGHGEQQKKLRLLAQKGKIPHALLFSGPEKVGKRTFALWFLKMINCEGKSRPCGTCRSCNEIEMKIHPDILEVFPEKGEIRLGQIEGVIEKAGYRRVRACFKAVIVDNAHLTNIQAQNALLKTLEEPSEDTVIILISEYPHLLLPTVLSRVFEVRFSFVPEEEIKKALEHRKTAELSLGRPGAAIDCLHFPEKVKEVEETGKELKAFLDKDMAFRFSVIKKVVQEEREEEFLNSWLRLMREKMIDNIRKGENTACCCGIIKEIEEILLLRVKTNINMKIAMEKIATKI